MFNVGMMEFIFLIIVAFVVVGPKDLPKVARAVARAIQYAKELSRDMIAALNLDEEQLNAAKEITNVKKTVEDVIDPKQLLAPIKKELDGIKNEIKSTVQTESQTKATDE